MVGSEEGADGYQTPVLRGSPFLGLQPSLTVLTLVQYISLAEVAGVCVVGPEEGADGYQTPVLRGRPFPGS